MKGLINKTLKLFLKSRYNALKNAFENPLDTQQELFEYLIDTAAHTEWGRKYRYNDIKNYNTFRQRVPVSDYEDLKPWISRMMYGEKDILWPGKVKWFSKSSGTTSDKSKFIPVSEENFDGCHKKGTWDTIAIMYHNNPDIQLFEKKSLILGGSLSHFNPHPETIYGDVSAIMITNMPLIGRPFYTPDVKVAIMDDWEKKLELTAELTIKDKDIASIGGVPTWNLVLFRRIMEKTGAKNMLEVWPKLRIYIHGGVNFAPYKSQFQKLIPRDDFIFQEVYNASEGYFGTQLSPDQKDLLLLTDNGVFYEFIPKDEIDHKNPTVLSLKEVEVGKIYALLISTNAGLWRYKIGDTVQFTGKNPYTFKIVGRTKQFINAFGEEVMVHNTDTALSSVSEKLNCLIKDYSVAPVYLDDNQKGQHEWLIEFEKEPENLKQFEIELDRELQQLNSDYEAKRAKNLALELLSVKSLPKGTFEGWLKYKNRQGAQVKVPRLSNDRKYVKDILDYLQIEHSNGL
ncbi:GH3 auxin-responsive promoter family protein [Membranihabitans maritimus]|uniref:GH3 auxin-responsive promoter family protein n=1 Tax=Membranihabitans maritimus TaxID=2904244 RepID=UPI001F319637|nr:GH3 auxin-responsive promoter family protein [Membranihabitans maritimus]